MVSRGDEGAPGPRPLVAASAATALLLLDVTVVYLAAPAIGEGLDASFTELQWVVDAYALAMAVVLLPAGALADRIGRRRVFLGGLATFAAASAACAAAPSAAWLDAARAVQGVGAAGLFATSLALIAAAYSGAERGRALGVWGAVSGIALAAGPVVGGAIVEGLDWRWIFWANLPAAGALALVARRIPESRSPAATRADWPGSALLALTLLLFVGALLQGERRGWDSPEILASLAGSLVLAGAFVTYELRAAAPMLDPRLFRDRALAATSAVTLLQSIAIYPVLLFFALELQGVFGYGALEAGVRVLPVTGALLVVAPLAGRLTQRVPLAALLAFGLAVTAAGLALGAASDVGDGWTGLLPAFLVIGLGIGVLSPALAAAIINSLAGEREGLASGIGNTFRQAGIAIGIAAFGVVFQIAAPDSVSVETMLSGGAAGAQAAAGFHDGLRAVLGVAAAVAAAGALAALAVRPARLPGGPAVPGAPPPGTPAVPRAGFRSG